MIRKFEKKDLQQCLELAQQQVKESKWSGKTFEVEKVQAVYLSTIGNPKRLALVVDHDGEIIGTVLCGLCQYNFSYNTYVKDYWLYLKPEHRGGMTAMKMYKAVYEWAKFCKAEDVYLGYNFGTKNKKMKNFFERMGYKHFADCYMKEVLT